jgi:hypothetical protein
MFENNDETADHNHIFALLAKAILKLLFAKHAPTLPVVYPWFRYCYAKIGPAKAWVSQAPETLLKSKTLRRVTPRVICATRLAEGDWEGAGL